MRTIEVLSNNCDERTMYGLSIVENGFEAEYKELTHSKEKIEQLKRSLADSDISAVHIPDIIKDFIAEEACNKLIANSLL